MFHFFMVIDVDFKDQIKMLLPSCYFPDVFISSLYLFLETKHWDYLKMEKLRQKA